MAFQTLPITLTWGPVVADISALDINQLGAIMSAQLAGTIRADVSFYLEVLIDPTSFVTNLVFNSQQRVFKAWDQSVGRYVPLTQYQIGDVKNSFAGGDQIAVGWVVLDGRAIAAIPGISQAQQSVLETLFGADGSLPIVTPQNIQGLPAVGSFSGLPVSNPPTEPEVEAIRDVSEEVLVALNNNTTPTLYSMVFIGFA